MQFGKDIPSFVRTFVLLPLFSLLPLSHGQGDPRNHVVEMSARPDSGGILLTWRGNSDAQGYTIYRRSGLNSGWEEVASSGGDATSPKTSAFGKVSDKSESFLDCGVTMSGVSRGISAQ